MTCNIQGCFDYLYLKRNALKNALTIATQWYGLFVLSGTQRAHNHTSDMFGSIHVFAHAI
jgi:hypothetical protein